jgi:hypothetical protein
MRPDFIPVSIRNQPIFELPFPPADPWTARFAAMPSLRFHNRFINRRRRKKITVAVKYPVTFSHRKRYSYKSPLTIVLILFY